METRHKTSEELDTQALFTTARYMLTLFAGIAVAITLIVVLFKLVGPVAIFIVPIFGILAMIFCSLYGVVRGRIEEENGK